MLSEKYEADMRELRLYAVCPDGTIEHYPLERVRPFLLGCDYHENYFLVARPIDVEARICDLVRR